MITYSEFIKKGIDLAPLGFQQSGDFVLYYCTPKKAKILAAAGIDGIHYCTIPDFGEMIFAVSPMNFGDCVHPIARSFEDLLRLLLSCVDMAALEQCYAWDEEQYKAFLIDCPATQEQQAVLDAIRNELGLTPIENAFSYVKELQAEFDYSAIPYTEDYYDPEMNAAAPERPAQWQVFFDGGYWTKNGKGRAGKEITLNSSFAWGEEIWHIPAIYSCAKGLVVDFCVEINPERMKAFLNKWVPVCEGDPILPRETQEELDKANPLSIDFRPHIFVNGKVVPAKHGCSINWIPESCIPDGTENPGEAKGLIKHYGLDETRAWSFHRWSCPWATMKKPVIQTFKLTLERRLETINGIHFMNPAVGDKITFVHPITHTEHTLTVVEYKKQELTSKAFAHEEFDFPTHHTAMTYTVEPELPNKNFQVRDRLDNDEPKRRRGKLYEPQANNGAFSIGIIGGADGPTAMILSNGRESNTAQHVALSALHFEPIDEIEWKIIFREKPMEDIEFEKNFIQF